MDRTFSVWMEINFRNTQAGLDGCGLMALRLKLILSFSAKYPCRRIDISGEKRYKPLPKREARFPVSWCHRITFLSLEDDAKIGPMEEKAHDVISPVCPPLRVLSGTISSVSIVQIIILPSAEQVARILSFGSTAQYNTAPSWPPRLFRWTNSFSYETVEDMLTNLAPTSPEKDRNPKTVPQLDSVRIVKRPKYGRFKRFGSDFNFYGEAIQAARSVIVIWMSTFGTLNNSMQI